MDNKKAPVRDSDANQKNRNIETWLQKMPPILDASSDIPGTPSLSTIVTTTTVNSSVSAKTAVGNSNRSPGPKSPDPATPDTSARKKTLTFLKLEDPKKPKENPPTSPPIGVSRVTLHKKLTGFKTEKKESIHGRKSWTKHPVKPKKGPPPESWRDIKSTGKDGLGWRPSWDNYIEESGANLEKIKEKGRRKTEFQLEPESGASSVASQMSKVTETSLTSPKPILKKTQSKSIVDEPVDTKGHVPEHSLEKTPEPKHVLEKTPESKLKTIPKLQPPKPEPIRKLPAPNWGEPTEKLPPPKSEPVEKIPLPKPEPTVKLPPASWGEPIEKLPLPKPKPIEKLPPSKPEPIAELSTSKQDPVPAPVVKLPLPESKPVLNFPTSVPESTEKLTPAELQFKPIEKLPPKPIPKSAQSIQKQKSIVRSPPPEPEPIEKSEPSVPKQKSIVRLPPPEPEPIENPKPPVQKQKSIVRLPPPEPEPIEKPKPPVQKQMSIVRLPPPEPEPIEKPKPPVQKQKSIVRSPPEPEPIEKPKSPVQKQKSIVRLPPPEPEPIEKPKLPVQKQKSIVRPAPPELEPIQKPKLPVRSQKSIVTFPSVEPEPIGEIPSPEAEGNAEYSQSESIYNISYEPTLDEKPDVQTTGGEKRDFMRGDIFGYRSKLAGGFGFIFRGHGSSAATHEKFSIHASDTDGRDMTWLQELSPSETGGRRKTLYERRQQQKLTKDSLHIFWFYLLLGGRMPFQFTRDPDSERRAVTCKFDRRRRSYYAFVVTTIFLLLMTALSVSSFFLIYFEEEDSGHPYTQVEKLLFEKNWLNAIILLTSLVMGSVGSLSVLISGEAMAEYITFWDKVLDELNFNATPGILTVTIVFIVWSAAQALFQWFVFFLRPGLNPFTEGIHFMTAIIFRYLTKEVLLSKNLHYYTTFALFLNTYAIYSARAFILMVVVYSVGITNLANEWNFRLRLILRQVTVKSNELVLRNVLQKINHHLLFDQHLEVVKLVKGLSAVFGVIILAFYFTESIIFSGELLELSIFLVGDEAPKFNQTTAEKVGYKYEKDLNNRLNTLFHLSQSVSIFFIVSYYLSATGEAVMEALHHINDHNHMNIVSTHQRDFVMSLMMSFNPKQPYLLGAAGLFSIDRKFMTGFFAGSLYFFSVMIQTRIPRLLSVPIVFECSPGSGTLCSGIMQVRINEADKALKMSLIAFEEMEMMNNLSVSTRPPTTTTTTTTTTTISTTTTTTPRPLGFPCNGSRTPESQTFKCKGAEVDRYIVYDENGFPKMSRLQNTFNCLYDPYPLSNGPYFDCFGNNLTVLDSCGMLNFGAGKDVFPGLVEANIVVPMITINPRSVMCYDLNKTFYVPSSIIPLGDKFKYICGIPHLLARVICFDPPTLRNLNLLDFQRTISEETRREINQKPPREGRCPGSEFDETIFSDRFDGSLAPLVLVWGPDLGGSGREVLDFLELPIRGPRARQYFPLFHPELLGGAQLNATFITVCRNPAINKCKCKGIPLIHDDCGGLDFQDVGGTTFTVPGPGTTFNCFVMDPIICNRMRCEEWRTWFNQDRPVF